MRDSPFKTSLEKYWNLRYDLFSKFDEGIQIDEVGLYSAKPEKISYQLAERVEGSIVLDAFGGVGASAIGFALCGKHVICIEKDLRRYEMIKNNICVYGVQNKIKVINADVLNIKDTLRYDAVYLDPPWGGPSYIDKNLFSLENFEPNGNVLLKSFQDKAEVILSVPVNFDMNELSQLCTDYCLYWAELNGKSVFANVILKNKVTE